ncbi:MAG: hypothetical protein K8W52_01655 [Deltaproteobacteria bacterium]|nr:hypothetical protein [Deltaproteobacteria bacterium]
MARSSSVALAACVLATALAAPRAFAKAPAKCPAAVTAAIKKAFPRGAIRSCKAEHDDGADQFAVVVKTGTTRVEVDVAPDGAIKQIEQRVAVDQVPAAVLKAFAAKYPKAEASRAQRQQHADKSVCFELGFTTEHGKHEATFSEAGAFLEEE